MSLVHQRIAIEDELTKITERVKSLKELVSTGTQEATDLKVSELEDLKSKYERYEISNQYERENDTLNLLKVVICAPGGVFHSFHDFLDRRSRSHRMVR